MSALSHSSLATLHVTCACAWQVYKGRLRSTGEEVAVKVQRPNISENIAIDMLLLRRFIKLVDANLPSLVDVRPLSCSFRTPPSACFGWSLLFL